ncbi:MAG: hypothetical protein QXR74_07185 [Candidatus Bathyarchaeia archaeon]
MKKVTKKELVLKAVTYRALVVIGEALLAFVLSFFAMSLVEFVVVNNLLKLAGYLLFELWWFAYLRSRLDVLGRIRRKLAL